MIGVGRMGFDTTTFDTKPDTESTWPFIEVVTDDGDAAGNIGDALEALGVTTGLPKKAR